jgi:putative DNA modification/repair radical SAM protein
MIIQDNLSLMEKLTILSDAAKYDAACTSSGVDKKNNGQGIGNSKACGICHSFSADGRCISLLKILFTNECIFDCRYCVNRSSNDIVRATFTPDEVCQLTIEFYRRNYIEGLFLSSGIIKSPDETMKLLFETVMLLRTKYKFGGYIHLKGIPGASEHLIEMAGWYVDRMSINLELPTADGLKSLAPHKTRKTILTPMRQIQQGIDKDKSLYRIGSHGNNLITTDSSLPSTNSGFQFSPPISTNGKQRFVPAGQSTQMIIGATKENDYEIVTVAEALYKQYDLKRVFYSAFINVNQDTTLPIQQDKKDVPLLREHRLYQADWLMRFYGFQSQELLSASKPNFNVLLDPKCDWAVNHLEQFPVEINTANYYTLLRVPGIGVNSARRIVKARSAAKLDFNDIKRMGVVLKRALFFITCSGRMMYPTKIDQDYITNGLIGEDARKVFEIEHHNSYRQLSLFDDCNFG